MKAFPQDLIDAFNADEVVCICGSGPSVSAGFPSWSKLLELMIEECEHQLVGFVQGRELRRLVKNGHLPEVADECSRLLNGQLYRDFLQRVFRNELIRPAKLHEILTKLPFSAVLTTNYDSLIERSYLAGSQGAAYPLVYTHKNAAQLPKLASEKRFFIFKLHGDVEDIQTIVLTKRDYGEIINNSELYRTALSLILATRTALFIGYGLRDHDLNLVLSEQTALFKAYGRRHYAFLPDPGTVLPKMFLEHYNVTVIPYAGKRQHAELEVLLTDLTKQVKSALPPNEGEETRKLRQLMQIEREYCRALGAHIELTRAGYLRAHAWSYLSSEDRELVEDSLKFWEDKEKSARATEAALSQSQKMESIGQLAGGVAHDFNNILTVIHGNAELLLMDAEQYPASAKEGLEHVVEASERAANLTRQLLVFSRKQVLQPQPLVLNDVIDNLTKMLQRIIGEDIDLQCAYTTPLPFVQADQGMMEQVILNLVVNARDAMPKGGQLTIATSLVDVDLRRVAKYPEARPGPYIRLTVTDTGCGMSKETLGRIFEPFFTTKEIGKGTGLGLATVYGIVRQHKGWIEVASELGAGTTFHVLLPPTQGVPRITAREQDLEDLRGSESILVVEDDVTVRLIECEVLKKHGYKVSEAGNGPEAIRVWKASNGAFDLLVTDMVMPEGMTGYELSLLLLKEKPTLGVVYASGYSPEVVGKKTPDLGHKFIQKPFSHRVLLSAIRSTLDAITSQQRPRTKPTLRSKRK